MTSEQYIAFYEQLKNNQVVLTATNAEGDVVEYKIRPENSFNIFIKNTDLENPHFSRSDIHASIVDDDKGNVYVVEYSPKPPAITSHLDFARYYFAYPFVFFWTDDMSKASALNQINNPVLNDLAVMMVKDPHSLFTLEP